MPLPKNTENSSVVTMAHHMADAVGYLMRVATEAGLLGIASKLAGVRASLLGIVAGGSEDDGPARTESNAGSPSQVSESERHDGHNAS
jgi:hypothetical protein